MITLRTNLKQLKTDMFEVVIKKGRRIQASQNRTGITKLSCAHHLQFVIYRATWLTGEN